ncbi:hypothetical protein Pth03_11400 [Planotetraspora thailandica]|uniref:JmjC domain-containing protein n=1 Tax=Planotetraspora thailandica TaxID=487172 RepID=A0A8J3UXM7_9ACTN|nr:hypothetical protein [Planotetraspora thailandica]GII52751.1 hypothetical protein Pth03_11400 [Planotetraspora thailandica]
MSDTKVTIVKTPDSAESTRIEKWDCAAVTPEKVWKGVMGAVRAVLAGDDQRELVKITVGAQVLADTSLMPAPEGTETPEMWLKRLQEKYGAGTPILLYARELSVHDRDMFELLLSAFGEVFEQHGLVAGNIDIEVFLGEYKATPGGIHREQCGNSHFVLQGKKFMHFWHGEDWIPSSVDRRVAEGMTAIDPEEYLPSLSVPSVVDRGTSFIASAGEFFTWDPGTWHVAETVGPAFAVNIARYTKSFVSGEGTYPFSVGTDGQVSEEWLTGYRDFLGAGVDEADALARASAYGLDGPDPERSPADDPSAVVVRSHAPRLWYETDGAVLVATHGRSRRFPRTVLPWFVELSGLPLGVPRDTPADEDARDLTRFLVENGALAAA